MSLAPLRRRRVSAYCAGAGLGDWTVLLNINTLAEGVRHTLFGGEPNGAVANATLAGSVYLATAIAVVVVGVAAYLWRYQRIET